jgi:glycosyltransferase involved in cell wall biosynthesis
MLLKGQDLVLEAMKPLLDEYGLQLLFVGRLDVEPGDDGSRMADLMAEVNGSNDLRRRVHFLGARVDMPAIMAAADFLVHVPRKEAFGVVLAEAMAIGLPVIASRVGGIPEVLDGTDSIVIPPNDAHALRAAVLGYLRWSPEKRAECIRKGRERAMDFHPDRRTDQILALLQGSRH